MGDGGAYLLGFFLAAVGVMIPQRNPEASPWIVLVVLSYPVLETLYSIFRRTLRKGDGPGQADNEHLHHLLYGHLCRILSGTQSSRHANPAVSTLLWGVMAASLLFVLATPNNNTWALPAFGAQAILYLVSYRILEFASRRRRRH